MQTGLRDARAPLHAQRVDQEAAWGFVAEKDALVMYPALLPCTLSLEFDPEAPEGALLRARHCYEDQAPRIEDATGAGALGYVPCRLQIGSLPVLTEDGVSDLL